MTGPSRVPCLAILILVATLATAVAVDAQEDRAAGLFTHARQLPLVSQSVELEIGGGEATIRLVQAFTNDGPDEGQADYRLHLPEGASISAFGFWQGERFLAAELKEREQARADHRRAADEHRTTGLLQTDGHVTSFSVYPLAAGEVMRVETTIAAPVVSERGRTHVALPIDRFLGDLRLTTPVLVHVVSEEPLAGFGAAGQPIAELDRREREARFAFSSDRQTEVWFSEAMPPLLAAGEAAPLGDGTIGIQLRIMLNDASEWSTPPTRIELLVDASHSMRRRVGSVRRALERIALAASAPVEVVAVGDEVRSLGRLEDATRATEALFAGADYGASWASLVEAARALGCYDSGTRCLAITDPQLRGLGEEREQGLRMLFLADPYERDAFATVLGAEAPVYEPGVDPEARLTTLADAAVTAVIRVDRILQQGAEVESLGTGPRWVPEGALLRLYAFGASLEPLEVEGWIDDSPVAVTVTLDPLAPLTFEGRTLRRAAFRELLADWMLEWRRTRDAALRARIVELSLREGIPTAFTALHVADPRLSLSSFRPGDPILTVPAADNVESVTAWYPFGRHVTLARDPETGLFSDRFLVPRGWADGGYRVRIARRHRDGEVDRSSLWYRLDSRGPDATLELDRERRELVVDTGDATPGVAAVLVFTDDARQLALAPVGSRWSVPLERLGERFTVVVRDRATNRTVIRCRLGEHGLELGPVPAPSSRLVPAADAEVPEGLVAARGALALLDRTLRLDLGSRSTVGRLEGVPRSLAVTSLLEDGGEVLVGTAGGDLIRFAGPRPGGDATARVISTGHPDHPVTGLARLADGRLLVAVLGGGLYELDGDRVRPSRISVGTRYVTALRSCSGLVFVGTSGRGLWRIVDGRAVRTRLPEAVVTGLGVAGRQLEVRSIVRRFLRRGCDRFESAGPLAIDRLPGSSALTAAAIHQGRLVVGRLQGGIAALTGAGPEPIEIGLDVEGGRVNDLASFAGALWIAAEGGLYRSDGATAERLLPFAVHALASDGRSLAAATASGLWVTDEAGTTQRWDAQGGTGRESLAAVAWWRGTLLAGGRDGLWRFAGPGAGTLLGPGAALGAGNVSALLADGDRVLVGTADRGVFVYDGWRLRPVRGLEELWVSPGGLSRAGDAVWVGTIGAPPACLLDTGAVERIPVPTRDVNRVVEGPDGHLWLLTSDGLMALER